MFTQRISMDCTYEQYEKYLKDELLKMGYIEEGISLWGGNNDYITNCFGSEGKVGNINIHGIRTGNVTYLGSFNAPLFLALAAMTDKAEGNYGEYVIGLNSGMIYKMNKEDKMLLEYALIRKATKEEIMAKFGNPEYKIGDYLTMVTKGDGNFIGILRCPLGKNGAGFMYFAGIDSKKEFKFQGRFAYWGGDDIRCSTREEIEELDKRLAEKGRYFDKERLEIRPLSEKKCNHNTLENKIDQLNKEGKVEINTPFNKTEIESGVGVLVEELMKNIEKVHIDALKSRGYKILKPKTWEEI